jgi:large subunit ribosomal protein L4
MASIKVYNLKKQEVGQVELADSVFGAEVKPALVHQAIVTQLAGRRRGTASTKTKAEVRGGGRKPFRQKGTGNARQGSTRSPLMPGGGESFGPKPRSYEKAFPKKMAQAAMRSVLTDKLQSERIVVIDQFSLAKPKTKEVAGLVAAFGWKKALLVDGNNKTLELAGRNLPRLKVLKTVGLNVFDVVDHEWLVISKSAAEELSTKLATKSKRVRKAKEA